MMKIFQILTLFATLLLGVMSSCNKNTPDPNLLNIPSSYSIYSVKEVLGDIAVEKNDASGDLITKKSSSSESKYELTFSSFKPSATLPSYTFSIPISEIRDHTENKAILFFSKHTVNASLNYASIPETDTNKLLHFSPGEYASSEEQITIELYSTNYKGQSYSGILISEENSSDIVLAVSIKMTLKNISYTYEILSKK